METVPLIKEIRGKREIVGNRVGSSQLDTLAKEEISCPYWGIKKNLRLYRPLITTAINIASLVKGAGKQISVYRGCAADCSNLVLVGIESKGNYNN